jgi:hypothetical protein
MSFSALNSIFNGLGGDMHKAGLDLFEALSDVFPQS